MEPHTSSSVTMKMPDKVVMLTRAEQYRAKAEQCATQAKAARDPETKHLFEDMVRQWLDLAKWVEHNGG